MRSTEVEKATFAAGCFWGVEADFRRIDGVTGTMVGYTGGHTDNPTYEEVCRHRTGHAEAVQVEFDPAVVSYDGLLTHFWRMHNPTARNRQGLNFGDQYRSAIFWHSEEQREAAEASGETEASKRRRKIATKIVPASQFYMAEEYHQRYEEKNGRAACNTVLRDALEDEGVDEVKGAEQTGRGIHKTEAEWRKELSPQQYRVLRNKGTERAFTGEYVDHHDDGGYRCAGCGAELFSSETKFDSRTGWPSFTDPTDHNNVKLTKEGLILRRIEVSCKACGGHLGHVFNDGPGPSGKRYCINSCALEFDPTTASPT